MSNEHLVCLHEDRWAQLQADIAEIKKSTRETHDKIFVGNGTPAFTVRLDRVERVTDILTYITGAVCLAAIIAGLGTLFAHLWQAK